MDLNQLPEAEGDRLIKQYGDLAEAGRALERAMDLGGDCQVSQRMLDLLLNRAQYGDYFYRLLSAIDGSFEYDKIDAPTIGGRVTQFDPETLQIWTSLWDQVREGILHARASGKFKEPEPPDIGISKIAVEHHD